ncbi:MAG: hypothetical protein WBE22_09370 [Halobacteriota archaeon]
MKNMASIKEVLENIEHLDISDQTYILGVLSKRLIELKRSEIAKRAIEAEQAFSDGKVKSGTLDDLWNDFID